MARPQRSEHVDEAVETAGAAPRQADAVRLREVTPPGPPDAEDSPEARAPARDEPPRVPPEEAPSIAHPQPDSATAPKADQNEPVDQPNGRRRGLRRILFALVPVALIAGGYFYVTGGAVMTSDNAYVQADKVAVSTDVSGIVKAVDVTDNQRVTAGDLLFELDDLPFRLALTRAQANLATTRDQILALKANYRDMQAQIEQAKADIAFYTREFERQKTLVARQAGTEQAFDAARHNLQLAQQKLASLEQQLAGIAANLNQNPDIRPEDHPRYVDALAQRDEAARQLSHTKVRAPFAGIVTNVPSLQPGQYLAASTAAFSVVATDHVWVESQPKETELTHVQPGQPVTVTVDTYPGQEWHGTVESLAPASGATFSLLPAQNTSGNWVKVVQRIPIRVRLDTPDDKPRLRVGMSVEIDVDTGHPRGLPSFVRDLLGGAAEAAASGASHG